jgi:hypothetical protein
MPKLLSILLFLLLLTACSNSLPSGPDPSPATTYARIVIDTYEPHGGFPAAFAADTYLTLYGLKNGNWEVLAEDDDSNLDSDQGGSSRMEILDMVSGQYFLKVTKGPTSPADTIGPYAVRVLSLEVGAFVTSAYPASFDVLSDEYEKMDAPEATPPLSVSPVSVDLGVDNLGRVLDSKTDIDWLEITLP